MSSTTTDRQGKPAFHDLATGEIAPHAALSRTDRHLLQARQAQSIMRMTPWTILLNMIVSVLLVTMVDVGAATTELRYWALVNGGLSLAILLHWRIAMRRCGSRKCAAAYVKVIHLQGLLLGMTWAALPLLAFGREPSDLRTLIGALTLGAFSLGAFRLAQVPLAAVSYIAFPSSALAVTALTTMDPPYGLYFALLSLFYGAALILVVIMRYRDALRHAAHLAELNRRKNIINLLLHDFEQGASDWLWETDAHGNLTYAPRRLEELLGKHRDDLKGYCLHTIFETDAQDEGWSDFYAAFHDGRIISGIVVPAMIDGERRWFRMTARPLYDAAGSLRGYRGVASDVTEQHRQQERLQREKEAAEDEARAKSNFLAVISHELRTPLNAMVGFSELMAHESAGPLDETYREYSEHILNGSRQLQRLINDILDYTRFERNKIKLVEQEVDIVELAETCLRQVARDDRARGLDLELRYADDIIVEADLGRLQQVLSNLLTNAVKFTQEGSVVVDIDRTADGDLVVSVIDTGPGIPQELLESLFEPFTQAENVLSRRHDGIGLGLSIARSLVRLHGGELTLENNEGPGATARFTLPAARIVDDDDTGTQSAPRAGMAA